MELKEGLSFFLCSVGKITHLLLPWLQFTQKYALKQKGGQNQCGH